MATTQDMLDNARRLQRAIALKVDRQAATLAESRGELEGIDAYIRDLEKIAKAERPK